jgi:hypothetical protein
MSQERERKPYNPFHLAGGYAAECLPDKKTAAVFARLCNHTDYLGGSVSCSIETIAKETKYSPRAVNYAVEVLKSLGRVTKRARGIVGQVGGRKSSITTVHCTAEELQKAGANDENFFGRGGKAGLIKAQTEPIQSAKRVHSKRKQDAIKTQRVALEPLKSEPFLLEPIKAEPLKAGASQSQRQETSTSSTQGMKEHATPTPGAAGNTIPAGRTNPLKGSAARPIVNHLSDEAHALLKAVGCPIEALIQIGKLEHWCKALNNTTNVITSYETLAMKDNKMATKLFGLWMPKRLTNASPSGNDDDFMGQSEREYLLKEAARPREERYFEQAKGWWSFLDDDDRHALVDFPEGVQNGRRSYLNVPNDQILEVYRLYDKDYEGYKRKLKEAEAKGAAA